MGPLQDRIGFKTMYSSILVTMFVVYATIPYVVQLNAMLYSVWVVTAFFCLGTHFTMFPLVNIKVFGQKSGGQMASFIYISSGLSGLTSLWVSNILRSKNASNSFEIMCFISCITIAISFCICRFLFKEEEIRHKGKIFEKLLPEQTSVTSTSISFSSD